MSSPRRRALVLCPGRGSYGRDSLGSLEGLDSPALDTFDALRRGLGRPTVRELDAAESFRGSLHIAGEHASSLTAAASLADLEALDPDKVEVVAVCGNSMGWYTALAFAGALSLEDGARLVETMGAYQARAEQGVVGGQIVYPLVDGRWRPDPALLGAVSAAVAAIPELHWSIRLGGQAVLGGSTEALAAAQEALPGLERGAHRYPLRLPLHSAFHTPLLAPTAARAQVELAGLGWRAPRLPLVDGRGASWRPLSADPGTLRDYTLGHQVTEPFDFTAMLQAALGAYAPDLVILPGPGSSLGGAIGQVLVGLGWQGLRSKDDFVRRQTDPERGPVLAAMRWPDQRRVVARTP